jgi:hypothetical protein
MPSGIPQSPWSCPGVPSGKSAPIAGGALSHRNSNNVSLLRWSSLLSLLADEYKRHQSAKKSDKIGNNNERIVESQCLPHGGDALNQSFLAFVFNHISHRDNLPFDNLMLSLE